MNKGTLALDFINALNSGFTEEMPALALCQPSKLQEASSMRYVEKRREENSKEERGGEKRRRKKSEREVRREE